MSYEATPVTKKRLRPVLISIVIVGLISAWPEIMAPIEVRDVIGAPQKTYIDKIFECFGLFWFGVMTSYVQAFIVFLLLGAVNKYIFNKEEDVYSMFDYMDQIGPLLTTIAIIFSLYYSVTGSLFYTIFEN